MRLVWVVIPIVIIAIVGFYVSTPSGLQTIFNDVPSVVILTEKERYAIDEPILITIKNVGDVPMVFNDDNYGISIVRHDKKSYDFDRELIETILYPNDEHTIIFDGDPRGFYMNRYSISTSYSPLDSNMVYSLHKRVETWIDLEKDPNYSSFESHMVPSAIIITDKTEYKLGEPVKITVTNVGTIPLGFGDSNFGISVTNGVCCGGAYAIVMSLSPGAHHTLVWEQYNWADEKTPIKPGEYEATSFFFHEGFGGYTVKIPFSIVDK